VLEECVADGWRVWRERQAAWAGGRLKDGLDGWNDEEFALDAMQAPIRRERCLMDMVVVNGG
jgi:hypothetical protein